MLREGQRTWFSGKTRSGAALEPLATDVDVYLVKRANKVTEGLLSVEFKPLADKVPEKEADAPF